MILNLLMFDLKEEEKQQTNHYYTFQFPLKKFYLDLWKFEFLI